MIRAMEVLLEQVTALTRANLKVRYRKTVAGFLWVVLNPIILFGIQGLVFRKFLRLDVPNYGLFLLTGLLPWIFIAQTLEMCTSIFVTSGRLLKSYPVSPLVYLAAQVADCLINFACAFLLVLVPVWLRNPGEPAGLLLLPLAFIPLLVGTLGFAWLLATAQVFLRDTRFLVSFALGVAFFLTPVLYPAGFVPPQLAWIVWVNPFYKLIAPFRSALYVFSPATFAQDVAWASVVAGLALGAAALAWKQGRNGIYFHI
jgi:lipopolysaccharide transport system permease protein